MLTDYLELLDWRRRMAALFVELRRRPADAATLAWFRSEKDELFRSHPQSPLSLAERGNFRGLPYWPFDPSARAQARFMPARGDHEEAAAGLGEPIGLKRIGRLEFRYGDAPFSLGAFWVEGYAGGLFVPFRDQTSGRETYGGGRYLLDTIKSADLGSDARVGTVVLDFNYAYHPSCAYDPRWACPLAPPENVLPIPVRAGERLPGDGST